MMKFKDKILAITMAACMVFSNTPLKLDVLANEISQKEQGIEVLEESPYIIDVTDQFFNSDTSLEDETNNGNNSQENVENIITNTGNSNLDEYDPTKPPVDTNISAQNNDEFEATEVATSKLRSVSYVYTWKYYNIVNQNSYVQGSWSSAAYKDTSATATWGGYSSYSFNASSGFSAAGSSIKVSKSKPGTVYHSITPTSMSKTTVDSKGARYVSTITASTKSIQAKGNTEYGTVKNASSTAYPNNGVNGSYWYVSAGTIGVLKPTLKLNSISTTTAGNAVTVSGTANIGDNSGNAPYRLQASYKLNNGSEVWLGEVLYEKTYSKTFVPTVPGTYTITLYGRSFKENDVRTDTSSTTTSFTVNPQQYKISYNANGGTGNMGSHSFFSGNGVRIANNTFTRTGYTFDGWYLNSSGTGTKYLENTSYTLYGNAEFYAKWKANNNTISYNANGGTGTIPNQSVLTGSTIALNNGIAFTRNGYVLSGWNTSSNETGVNYSLGQSTAPTSNLVLYAKWTPIYTITYNLNNGTGTVPSSQNFAKGSNVKLASSTGITRAGYTFAGWNTSPNGTGTNYNESSSSTFTANTTLYAKWTALPTYNVTYNLNGGNGSTPTTQSFYQNGTVTISNPTNISKSGYTFAGWNTSPDGTGSQYNVGQTYKLNVAYNITLYAKWTPSYNVIYNLNGGSGTAPTTQSFYQNGTVTISNPTNISKPGYTFAGWNTSPDGIGVQYNVGQTYTLNVAYNITLYAKWTALPKYNVTYNLNGGSGTAPTTQSFYQNETVTISNPTNISKPGYTFVGWSTSPDGTGVQYNVGQAYTLNVANNITLYAKWAEAPKYTVTYNLNGGTITSGTAPTSQSFAQGTSITLPSSSNIVKSGYTFAGWNTSADGRGANYTASTSVKFDRNTTLYANWTTSATININYNLNLTADYTAGTPNTSTAVVNTSITLPDLKTINSGGAGKKHIGWSLNPNSTSIDYLPGSNAKFSTTTTLYGVFETVRKDNNPKIGQITDALYASNKPDPGTVYFNGKTFQQWGYTDILYYPSYVIDIDRDVKNIKEILDNAPNIKIWIPTNRIGFEDFKESNTTTLKNNVQEKIDTSLEIYNALSPEQQSRVAGFYYSGESFYTTYLGVEFTASKALSAFINDNDNEITEDEANSILAYEIIAKEMNIEISEEEQVAIDLLKEQLSGETMETAQNSNNVSEKTRFISNSYHNDLETTSGSAIELEDIETDINKAEDNNIGYKNTFVITKNNSNSKGIYSSYSIWSSENVDKMSKLSASNEKIKAELDLMRSLKSIATSKGKKVMWMPYLPNYTSTEGEIKPNSKIQGHQAFGYMVSKSIALVINEGIFDYVIIQPSAKFESKFDGINKNSSIFKTWESNIELVARSTKENKPYYIDKPVNVSESTNFNTNTGNSYTYSSMANLSSTKIGFMYEMGDTYFDKISKDNNIIRILNSVGCDPSSNVISFYLDSSHIKTGLGNSIGVISSIK